MCIAVQPDVGWPPLWWTILISPWVWLVVLIFAETQFL